MSNPEVLLIEPPSAEIAAATSIRWIGTSAANVQLACGEVYTVRGDWEHNRAVITGRDHQAILRHISVCGKCRAAVEAAT